MSGWKKSNHIKVTLWVFACTLAAGGGAHSHPAGPGMATGDLQSPDTWLAAANGPPPETPIFANGFEAKPVIRDSDGDGLSDSEEARLGTEPNNPDTDGDGLRDGEEVYDYRTNPLLADTDGDDVDDWLEILKSTDPLDPNSFPGDNIPVDPVLVAPDLMAGEVTTVKSAVEFLYDGPVPIQTGVNPVDILATRAALIRGRVFERGGAPLAGVRVTILGHPEFGETLTRTDGMFDMVVNGGGKLVVDYDLAGYAPAQRHMTTQWNSWNWADDLAMVPLDSVANPIDLTSVEPFQVAQASIQTDDDGSRQATLLFPRGTTAELVMPDGSTSPISNLTVRATEYTVGEDGPAAMPAPLPPTNTYTYAAELSVDEAIAAGADSVSFSQDIIFYVGNFLDFPAGAAVPVGFYNETKGVWEASSDGVVIDIVGETKGIADLDVDGDGVAEDSAKLLNDFGITEAERQRIAELYEPLDSLWRAETDHFTTIDCNFMPRSELRPPGERPRIRPKRKDEDDAFNKDPCKEAGSVIECQSRVLRESLPIIGTGLSLNYRSDRSENLFEAEVRITADELPPDVGLRMSRIFAVFEIAGRQEIRDYAPALGIHDTFTWDGRDAFGRLMLAKPNGKVTIYYDYPAYNLMGMSAGNGGGGGGSGGGPGASFGYPATQELLPDDFPGRSNGLRLGRVIPLEGFATVDSRALGTGGWTASVHHFYDPSDNTLHLGSGEVRSAKSLNDLVVDELIMPSTTDFVMAEDGTIYANTVNRFGYEGILATWSEQKAVAKGEATTFFPHPDGVTDWSVMALDIGPRGNIWFVSQHGDRNYVENNRVHELGYMTPDGDIHPLVNDLPDTPRGLAVDDMGGVYFTLWPYNVEDQFSHSAIYFLSADVLQSPSPSMDDVIEVETDQFLARPFKLAMDHDGSLYVMLWGISNPRIYPYVGRIDPDGKFTRLTGSTPGQVMDGQNALDISFLYAQDIFPDERGGFYLAAENRIIYVNALGTVRVLAGGADSSERFYRLKRPRARDLELDGFGTNAVGLGSDGKLYAILYRSSRYLVRLDSVLRGFTGSELIIASHDGTQLFAFSPSGRHLRTMDGATGQVLLSFGYDGRGWLTEITDFNGESVRFERPNDQQLRIIAPDGATTLGELNNEQWLTRIEDPKGNRWQLGYDIDAGRLTSLTDRNDELYQFTYGDEGAFESELGPDGSQISLSDNLDEEAGLFEITLNDRAGLQTLYERELLGDTSVLFTNTDPMGGVTTIQVSPGQIVRNYSTGTQLTTEQLPDSRLGLEAPLTRGSLRTPAGRQVSFENIRLAVLSDSNDLLSVEGLTSTMVVGPSSIQSTLDVSQKTVTLSNSDDAEEARTFDANWNPVSAERAGLLPQLFTWDDRGRLASTTLGNESLAYTYDNLGELATVTDAAGNVEQYERDEAGNLQKITLPSDDSVTMAHDPNGNMLSLAMPSGDIHDFGYDAVNQMTTYTDPLDNVTTHVYDTARRRERTIHADGTESVNSFDAAGRIAQLDFGGSSVTFGYRPNTKLPGTLQRSGASGGSQSMTWGWDGHLPVSLAFTGAANGSFEYDYDNGLRLDSITLDGGTPLTDTWGSDGLLASHGPFTLTRDSGTFLPAEWADGTGSLQFEYDGLGRETRRWTTVDGVVVYDQSQSWNNTDQIVQRVETVGGVTTTLDYIYNANGALTTLQKNSVDWETYGYDVNGNRSSVNSTSATYDAADRVTAVGAIQYTWDDNGYLASRGSDTFRYSVRGELLTAATNGKTINYAYDAMGRLVARIDDTDKTEYLYGNPAALHIPTHSRAPDGTLTTYFYDESGLLYAFERGGAMYYVATDQVGSPRVIADATGAVVRTIEYTPWGEITADSNPGFDLAIGYAGGIADPDTGLVRFLMRDYDPISGRWTARDPALHDGGINLYMYANSDPVSHRDPLGFICLGASAYAGVGGGVSGCYEDGKWSLCSEVGAGAGGGLSVNPFGKVARTERFAKLKLSAGFGPLAGVSTTLKATDCGDAGGKGGLAAKADCTTMFLSCSSPPNPDINSVAKSLRKAKAGDDVFKFSAKATATIGACAQF